jgi:hypothetical protein
MLYDIQRAYYKEYLNEKALKTTESYQVEIDSFIQHYKYNIIFFTERNIVIHK